MHKILLCLVIALFGFTASSQAQFCDFTSTCDGGPFDGDFCLSDSDCEGSAMPVELSDFTSYQNKDGIVLIWITATELNNEGFQIEISTDGENWEEVGFVQGKGTSEQGSDYSFSIANKHLQLGRNYFRLQQRDFDGTSEYSHTIVNVWNENDAQLVVFPNPAQDWIAVFLPKTLHNKQAVPYRIVDLTGRQLAQSSFDTEFAGAIEVSMLEAGSYFLFVGTEEEIVVARFVKQ